MGKDGYKGITAAFHVGPVRETLDALAVRTGITRLRLFELRDLGSRNVATYDYIKIKFPFACPTYRPSGSNFSVYSVLYRREEE